jgi:hypothetical protein
MVHLRSRAAGNGSTSGTVFQLFLPDDPTLTAEPPMQIAEAAS